MSSAPASANLPPLAGPASPSCRKPHPSAVSRLRAALKLVLAQAGPFERSIRVSIITDPRVERRVTTVLNTGAEISFNRHFLRQVADGSRRLHDILAIELARAATIALGRRARSSPCEEPVLAQNEASFASEASAP